jgi:hypothetical protein
VEIAERMKNLDHISVKGTGAFLGVDSADLQCDALLEQAQPLDRIDAVQCPLQGKVHVDLRKHRDRRVDDLHPIGEREVLNTCQELS